MINVHVEAERNIKNVVYDEWLHVFLYTFQFLLA